MACDLRLTNTGDTDAVLHLRACGAAADWALVVPSELRVAPSAEGRARLTFSVPHAERLTGRGADFTVAVHDQAGDGAVAAEVAGRIEIAEVHDVRVFVNPSIARARRRMAHTITVENRGTEPAEVTLVATDRSGALRLTAPAQAVLSVAPGERAETTLAVDVRTPARLRRGRTHSFVVVARPAVGTPAEAEAKVVVGPLPRRAVALAAAAVVLVAGWAGWRSPAAPGAKPFRQVTPLTSASAPVPSNCPSPSAPTALAIANFAFCPSTLTVAAGTELTWTNSDLAPHTATSAEGVFDSAVLRQGQSWRFRFDRPGTYPYFCVLHPGMRGEVVVK